MPLNRHSIAVKCATDDCANVEVIPFDAPLPRHWLCSVCEDVLLEQQVADMARRHQAKMARPYNFDRPIRRIADF